LEIKGFSPEIPCQVQVVSVEMDRETVGIKKDPTPVVLSPKACFFLQIKKVENPFCKSKVKFLSISSL